MKTFRKLIENNDINEGFFGDLFGAANTISKITKKIKSMKIPEDVNDLADFFNLQVKEIKTILNSSNMDDDLKVSFMKGFVGGFYSKVKSTTGASGDEIKKSLNWSNILYNAAYSTSKGNGLSMGETNAISDLLK